MFVAETDAEAERIARPAYKRWFDALAWLWVERGSYPPISISADYDASQAAGTLVVGSPATVGRILLAQAERIPHNYLVLLLAFGSLTHAQEMHSLALFAREIMPKLAVLNEEEPQPEPAVAVFPYRRVSATASRSAPQTASNPRAGLLRVSRSCFRKREA